MKNSVKIAIVLGAITSFFSVYPMAPSYYTFEEPNLKYVNPLSHMNDLEIFRIGIRIGTSIIPKNDPFFTENGLALHLTAIKVFEESNTTKNKKTLKAIHNAISEGIPVTSKHNIKLHLHKAFINIYPHQNPTSVFRSIEDWLQPIWFVDKDKKMAIFTAIFQGERKRKERLICTLNELKTKIPEDLVPIIIKYLPESNVDKDRTRCIEQAEQKFHEEQKSQPTLFKTSAYIEGIIKNKLGYE